MKYLPDAPRQDDPAAVMKHAGRYLDKKALIVLGGYSAKNWIDLWAEIKPDVVICANGANSLVETPDYWLCCENLRRSNKLATRQGDTDSIAVMDMFYREGAKYKMVSWHSWMLLKDTRNCIPIRRCEYDLSGFSFRDYGLGYIEGELSKYKEQWRHDVDVNTGTVGLQCLHHAGILGCSEIHTIGFDLLFRNKERHHAYEYPVYKADRFRSPKMFTTYEGFETQWTWIESGQFLKSLEPILVRDGIVWRDHSDGLLSLMKLGCAK